MTIYHDLLTLIQTNEPRSSGWVILPNGGANVLKLAKFAIFHNAAKLPTFGSDPKSLCTGRWQPAPELAGRSAIRRDVGIRLKRLRLGRPAKSMMLVGLRGGKKVLLDQMRRGRISGTPEISIVFHLAK
jgi:hypothetical protein